MIVEIVAPIVIFISSFYLLAFQILNTETVVEGSNSLFVPSICLILLMILSVFLEIKALITFKRKLEDKNKKIIIPKKFFLSALVSIIYIVSINILGYFIATPIFYIFFSRILGYKNLKISIISSITITIVVYFLFIKILYIPLPLGVNVFKTVNEFIIY